MNVTCDKCGKRYVISDDKVAGKASVKIRCKQCQNLITVAVAAGSGAVPSSSSSGLIPHAHVSSASGISVASGGGSSSNPWENESTRAMPALDPTVQWYAMIGGKQTGPFDLAALQLKVNSGEVTLRTHLWKTGMGDWKRASDVPEVTPIFAGVAAPPAPPRPPSKSVSAVQRDVAVSNEMPSSQLTRPTAQNGEGAVVAGHGLLGSNPSAELRGHDASSAATAAVAALNPSADVSATGATGEVTQLDRRPEGAGELGNLDLQTTTTPAAGGGTSGNEPALDAVTGLATQHAGQSEQQQDRAGQEHPSDPFAAIAGPDDGKAAPVPGEATRFFIAQAGVNKRNPPWKIALFVVAFVGGPISLVYLLNTFEIVKLPMVTRTDENGQEVQESFFSPGGAAGLKDLLTGDAQRKKERAEQERQARLAAEQARLAAAKEQRIAQNTPSGTEVAPVKPPPNPDLAALYGEEGIGGKGPTNRNIDPVAVNTGSEGLDDKVVSKVVADKLKSFELCIETSLRRNPNLAVGNVILVLNVGPSGVVKSTSIRPEKHAQSDWGQCMMLAGKRIAFPQSEGDTSVELPFKVGVNPL